MKAEVAQQRSLLALSELDAELSRLEHRSSHLPERAAYEGLRAEQAASSDRLSALRITLEDLDAQVAKAEADIEAVRQREERDRSLLQSGATDAKQLPDLQRELDTLTRRQGVLEDSLLEVMQRREEVQAGVAAEQATIDGLDADLVSARQAMDDALTEIDQTRQRHSPRRDALIAELDPALVDLYERQRARGGPGAAPLQGAKCGACRLEIDRGELARISAAADDELVRCSECNAILLRVRGSGQ